MKRKISILLIAATVALLSACTSTDENGVTISKGWFAQNSLAQGSNS